MSKLPGEGFVRLAEIIGPGRPIPIGKTAWWDGIKAGIYPRPIKLGPRVTAWRVEDIRKLIEAPGAQRQDADERGPTDGA